jgi:hypothetical protein
MNNKQRDNMLFNLGWIWGVICGMAGGVSIGYWFWG